MNEAIPQRLALRATSLSAKDHADKAMPPLKELTAGLDAMLERNKFRISSSLHTEFHRYF